MLNPPNVSFVLVKETYKKPKPCSKSEAEPLKARQDRKLHDEVIRVKVSRPICRFSEESLDREEEFSNDWHVQEVLQETTLSEQDMTCCDMMKLFQVLCFFICLTARSPFVTPEMKDRLLIEQF